ncbi:hypothetical protein C1H46_005072 [Malus baccata]|uniref:Root meristem growth factor 9 n=1 Tax=Malus baccata TaxID=106549 RepID=A0A540NEA1_MALBA|nr:hypothetical protein C1H46_005072 [Malus baccata]
MAAIPCKNLVVVALFLLCFISITAQGRRLELGVVSKGAADAHQKKSHDLHDTTFKQKQDDDQGVVLPDESNDLLAMDYTPARKKPPIHN